MPGNAACAQERRIPDDYRLLKLYRAAREDGHDPDPRLHSYQSGENGGFADTVRALDELVRPTRLAAYFNPQYTCGYYDGVARALRLWADRLEADRRAGEASARLSERVRSNGRDSSIAKPLRRNGRRASRGSPIDIAIQLDPNSPRLPAHPDPLGVPAMAETPDTESHLDSSSAQELDALQDAIQVLCRQTEQLIDEARLCSGLSSREAALQLETYTERRAHAMQLLSADLDEPSDFRVCRYWKVAQALECSRSYFETSNEPTSASAERTNGAASSARRRYSTLERIKLWLRQHVLAQQT